MHFLFDCSFKKAMGTKKNARWRAQRLAQRLARFQAPTKSLGFCRCQTAAHMKDLLYFPGNQHILPGKKGHLS